MGFCRVLLGGSSINPLTFLGALSQRSRLSHHLCLELKVEGWGLGSSYLVSTFALGKLEVIGRLGGVIVRARIFSPRPPPPITISLLSSSHPVLSVQIVGWVGKVLNPVGFKVSGLGRANPSYSQVTPDNHVYLP